MAIIYGMVDSVVSYSAMVVIKVKQQEVFHETVIGMVVY